MLKIKIEEEDLWDDDLEEFIPIHEKEICLEHSLASISKWEMRWKKPYLSEDEKTYEESMDYIRCMCLDDDIEDIYIKLIQRRHIAELDSYINDKMTATWFNDRDLGGTNRSVITNEVIYYWMFSQGIPLECEHWHFNRLMTLIKVFNAKNGSPKKMSKREIYEQNHALNQARKAKMKGGMP